MQKLALTFALATAAAAVASMTITSKTYGVVDPSQTLAMACCDDPPPPCWPSSPDCDKTNPPDKKTNPPGNLKSNRE